MMETTTIRPSKAYGIQQLSIATMKNLSDAAYRLHSYYCIKAGNKKTCWPTSHTIAEDLGWSKSKVLRAKAELIENGLIYCDIISEDGSNRYSLVTPLYLYEG